MIKKRSLLQSIQREVALTKQQIRTTILSRLRRQKEEIRTAKSRAIKEKLFRTKAFTRAKTVMFYIALDGEVDTKEMILEAQNLGKTIVVPVCRNRTIIAALFDTHARLQRGPYGVWEPVDKKVIDAKKLGLIVVPGVAFDKKGKRLGRGKGYYDRFLSEVPTSISSIGLAFDFQILPSLPATPTDVNVTRVIFA